MKIHSILYSLSIIGLFSLSYPCNGSGNSTNDDLNINAEDYAAVKLDDNTVIIDVRSEREFLQGHLEKAVLMDIYKPDFKDKVAKLNKDLTYYVYCATGVRSLHAVKYLRSIGIQKSFNVRGGIHQLAKAGIKIVN